MAIYRRLKYSDEEIRRRFLSFKDSNQTLFIKYILPYRFLSEKSQVISECLITINNVDGKATQAQLLLNKTDGTSFIGTRWMRMGNETEDDFEELYNFVDEVEFQRLGVFTYSMEEGTAAAEIHYNYADGGDTHRHFCFCMLLGGNG